GGGGPRPLPPRARRRGAGADQSIAGATHSVAARRGLHGARRLRVDPVEVLDVLPDLCVAEALGIGRLLNSFSKAFASASVSSIFSGALSQRVSQASVRRFEPSSHVPSSGVRRPSRPRP